MALKYANNAKTTLNGAITNVATSIVVTDGSVFPTLGGGDYFYMTFEDSSLNREIVKVTARSTNTLTVTRAQNGTSARAFSSGDKAEGRVVTGILDDLAALVGGVTPSAFFLTLVDDSTAGAFMTTLGITADGQSLITAANYAAMRTALGLVIGTNVQAYDADLTTWAGITPGTGWAAALAAVADSTTVRSALGLAIGTNVQAYDADLTTWAGITPGTGVGTALAIAVGSSGAFITNGGALGTPSGGTLTNCTGLPVSGITASTSTALGVGSIELGHASDTTITRVSAGVAAIEGSNILTASTIGSTVQAYDADLASWAGVTRASGFDTFTATPSSANLRSLVTDETGTGVLVFGTQPTFTSDITISATSPAAGFVGTILTNSTPTTGKTWRTASVSADGSFRITQPSVIDALTIAHTSGNATFSGTLTSGAIYSTADITAYYSDDRLKTRTGKIVKALDKLDKLDTFFYKENKVARSLGYKNDKEQVGVSAQQVKKVMPHVVKLAPIDIKTLKSGRMVSKSGKNYLTVDYAKLVPLLIAGIKELRAEVRALKGGK